MPKNTSKKPTEEAFRLNAYWRGLNDGCEGSRFNNDVPGSVMRDYREGFRAGRYEYGLQSSADDFGF